MNFRKYEPPQLEVCEPQIKGGAAGKHHVYKIQGNDYQGAVEVFRRFRNFDELREILFTRFLGLYVPPIPEKKKMVNLLAKLHTKHNIFIIFILIYFLLFCRETRTTVS